MLTATQHRSARLPDRETGPARWKTKRSFVVLSLLLYASICVAGIFVIALSLVDPEPNCQNRTTMDECADAVGARGALGRATPANGRRCRAPNPTHYRPRRRGPTTMHGATKRYDRRWPFGTAFPLRCSRRAAGSPCVYCARGFSWWFETNPLDRKPKGA